MSSNMCPCSERQCSNKDTFLCVKHCQRYVCFQHLQEHHRQYEEEKHDLPMDLKRRIEQKLLVYNRLIDPIKLNEQERKDIEIACTEIRRSYTQRRSDFFQLQNEAAKALTQNMPVNSLHSYLERLERAVESEQQRVKIYSYNEEPMNVKLEPRDIYLHHQEITDEVEESDFSQIAINKTTKSSKSTDEFSQRSSLEERDSIELNSINDDAESNSDHAQKELTSKPKREKKLNHSITIFRDACPLRNSGVFGILPSHKIRLCDGRPSCLYNHLQSFHHITVPSAYKICVAVFKKRDPSTTILFEADDIIYDENFHIPCPFSQDDTNPFDCQPKLIKKAPCTSIISRLDMPRHLRDVHQIERIAALTIVGEIRRCLKSGDKNVRPCLNPNLFDRKENITQSTSDKSFVKKKRLSNKKRIELST